MTNHLILLSLFTCLSLSGQAQTPIISVQAQPFGDSSCTGTFTKHALPHTTRAHGAEVTFYDSNGAGVAAGDLDADGDEDIVLANLDGASSILWNEGNLSFRAEALGFGDARAVAIVDVDADTHLDIVFTQSLGAPSYWRNVGAGFEQAFLSGVTRKAYTLAWGDLDKDGDLDLVTASYDSLLEKDLRDSFLFSSGAGVSVFENTQGGFVETRLADTAQALALTLFDVNEDGKPDILVGNDFDVPDYTFLNGSEGWTAASSFDTTTRNTMSFAVSDIDNDGASEVFATDMKPDFSDAAALAAWTPLMEKSHQRKRSAEAQKEENMLYNRSANGFENIAYGLGLDATGWSWSAKFGDLDHDGLLDLYVVNGMIAKDVFAHLPNNELVEANQAFRQTANGFEPAPDWGLGALESGRGMTMADFDNDGDLDIVVNNLERPATLFENALCGGDSLAVTLNWPDSGNMRGLGAALTLHSSAGTFKREVRSGGGYLSGDTSRVHFGVPTGAELLRLEILWPDGELSSLTVSASTLVEVTRE